MTLTVMAVVFTQFFGRDMPHYIIYMFCVNLLFRYFKRLLTISLEQPHQTLLFREKNK